MTDPASEFDRCHAIRGGIWSLRAMLAIGGLVVGLWGLAAGPISSADAAEDSRSIRSAARRILSSREFRHMKPLKRDGGAPKFKGSGDGGQQGDGAGGQPGDGQPDNGQGGRNGQGREGEWRDGKWVDGNEGGGRPGEGRFQDGRGEGDPGRFGERGDDWQPGGGNVDDSSTPPPVESESPSVEAPQSASALGQFFGGLFQIISWIITAIVVSVMAFLIVKGLMALVEWFQNGDRKISDNSQAIPDAGVGQIEPETAPGELPADVYVAKARELAAAGMYREAVAQLLLGAMSHIERAGLIKYRKGLTHRDYARAVRSQASMYNSMKSMVRVFEPLGFGRRDATQEHFQKSLTGYQAGFRATHSAK